MPVSDHSAPSGRPFVSPERRWVKQDRWDRAHASEDMDPRPAAEQNNATMDPNHVIADLMRRQLERIGEAGFYVAIGGEEEGAAVSTAVNPETGERLHVRAPEGYEIAAAVRLAEMVVY